MQDLKAVRFFYNGKAKVSHDYDGKDIHTFSYRELINSGNPSIGIPAKQNGFVIIDVDVPSGTHKHDGREWWYSFVQEKDISPTYTVRTRGGGFHFYYRLPDTVNPDTFSPPSKLALGVDIKYNGWVAAPPSIGYEIEWGTVADIVEAPPALMEAIHLAKNGAESTYEITYEEGQTLALAKPFTEVQLKDLIKKVEWIQTNGDLSYSEWRDGIFALKAGVSDVDLLQDLVDKWTMNRNFQEGDQHQAQDILDKADKYGGIGPGTIFAIIKEVAMRQGATAPEVELSPQEVIDRSGVTVSVKENGSLSCASTESNIASIIGAMYKPEQLYYDERQDLYVFKGEPIRDKELVNTLCPQIQSTRHGLALEGIKKATISGAVEVLMTARKTDPHRDWLKNIRWDGIYRIESFFHKYVGAEDSDYIRAVSKNFWIALAARGLVPGLKFDNIVVLEGVEGIRKSSLVEAIGGKYTFAPNTRKSFEDMDDLRKMHQSIVVELPELMGLVGQDANKVKAFLSKSHDNIRGLYERIGLRRGRGFIFIGTTNDSRYVSHDMGERRFWPINIVRKGYIDINAVEMDREQLFAEAVHRFQLKEPFYEVPMQEHSQLIKDRIISDPLVGPLREMLHNQYKVSSSEVYSRLTMMGYLPRGLTIATAKRIEVALYFIGYRKSGEDWILEGFEAAPACKEKSPAVLDCFDSFIEEKASSAFI